MKICNIDLNEGWSENFAGARYGGGNCIGVAALELLNDPDFLHNEFWIYASPEAFIGKQPFDDKRRCVDISEGQKAQLRSGAPVKDIIKNAERFDIFLHNFHNVSLNLEGLKGREVVWLVGHNETPHPKIPNILLYSRQYQEPFLNPAAKVYDVKIGRKIPPFVPRVKGNYIVQIQRHWKQFRSIEIASYCATNKIKLFMAGPIDKSYPLLDYVDGKYVKYLGEIDNEFKMELFSGAKLALFISDWPNSFSLGAIEALSVGCPVVCKNHGFWPSLIELGVNGFIVESEHEIRRRLHQSSLISQLTCWQSAGDYNDIQMVRSFTDAFHEILKA